MMRAIIGTATVWLLLCCLLPVAAWAGAPDPIEFGIAVERGDTRTVKRWLDEGLPAEYDADRLGTGLMIAAWNGNIEMMALFVERGANLRRANRNGEQPLQLAAWGGHSDAVHWLLERGATLNRPDLNWNALHYAVFNGHDKLSQQLIERGAEVNARSPNGSTPLMLAAREGREDLAKVLLESGADPGARNDWGDTALTLAMRYDHYRLGKMISSPEEFAIAVKAPKESFGQPTRAVAAPNRIEEILREMRAAEGKGLWTEDLRKELFTAVESLRRSGTPTPQDARRPAPRVYEPKTLVITAKRNRPGAERVEVLVQDKKAGKTKAKAAIPGKDEKRGPSPAQVSDLVRQIRLAEAQGQPADDLRRQLAEAVAAMK
jgi:ankyrin repeat protein